jgi:hypothetical protein
MHPDVLVVCLLSQDVPLPLLGQGLGGGTGALAPGPRNSFHALSFVLIRLDEAAFISPTIAETA